jgi:DNA-binding NarL/FixJ family response regulator
MFRNIAQLKSTSPIKRVMIVDDHDALRRGIRSLIESRSNLIVVGEAADGRSAIEEARRCAPEIAIIDYMMPEQNGIDLTLALKKEWPRLEILIYTMCGLESLVTEALRAGVRGFVTKSESEEHLLAALDALIIGRPYFSGSVSGMLLEQYLKAGPGPAKQSALTSRERQVVQLLVQGLSNKRVAREMGLSVKTVETHRAHSMHKLKFSTVADLVRYAVRNGLVEP